MEVTKNAEVGSTFRAHQILSAEGLGLACPSAVWLSSNSSVVPEMPLYCWGKRRRSKHGYKTFISARGRWGSFGSLGLCPISMAAPYAWIAWFLTGPSSAISRVSLS